MTDKSFKLNEITKIEGHAKLSVKIDNNQVKDLRLEVFEPSRFFEALTKGRKYYECSALTQRICGICSFIHTITSLKAMENILGITLSEEMKKLRELFLISGHIHSHISHLYFMSLPEYLGYNDAIELSEKNHDEIQRALRLKSCASEIGKIIGGRLIQPVTPWFGGFWSVPERDKLNHILEILQSVKKDAKKLVNLVSKIKIPEFQTKNTFFALKKEGEYQLYDGRIYSLNDLAFEPDEYPKYIKEFIKDYSTAKRCYVYKNPSMVGALARLNINYDYLSDDAKKLVKKSRINIPSFNPYHNNFAQAVEVMHFIYMAIDLTEYLLTSDLSRHKFKTNPKKGRGIATCEAPRGLLFHDYTTDQKGIIEKTNVITPTVFNLTGMEEDLKRLLTHNINSSKEQMISQSEKLIRAYDPCISCATHFLELEIKK
ncbi:MAG: Ni/Fe hydrogenase subunit alpha [Promethearchaeota archaeon]